MLFDEIRFHCVTCISVSLLHKIYKCVFASLSVAGLTARLCVKILSYKKINNNLFITVNNNNDNLKSIIRELHTSLKSVLFYFSFLKYMTRCELQVGAVTFQHTEAYPGLK